jgi:hypothetical protein
MSQILPADSVFLSAEQLDDDELELIFVQHDEAIDPTLVADALKRYTRGQSGAELGLTAVEGQTPLYPIAFDGTGFRISRPVDQYFVALPPP